MDPGAGPHGEPDHKGILGAGVLERTAAETALHRSRAVVERHAVVVLRVGGNGSVRSDGDQQGERRPPAQPPVWWRILVQWHDIERHRHIGWMRPLQMRAATHRPKWRCTGRPEEVARSESRLAIQPFG